jgi:hypothetical protein
MQGRPITARQAVGLVAVALAATTTLASRAEAQAPFEGVVTMRLNAGTAPGAGAAARPQELEYLIRNGKARVNLAGPGGGMAMIMVPAEKKMYMLMAAQHAYLEVPVSEVVSAAAAADAVAPKIAKTGRKERIAGYECETYTLTATTGSAAGQQTEICIAQGLGSYANPASMVPGAPQTVWQRALANAGFPLRVTTPGGQVALEVTKIEKQRLSNDLFTVPPTFTKMATPQLPKR